MRPSPTITLLVCLGNPGAEYEATRHNAGFLAGDAIIRRYELSSARAKFKSEVWEGNVGRNKVLLLKPQTFMNNSGEAAQAAAKFYKIPPANVITIYDELDLPVGKVKAKTGGGNGGHNGLRSLDAHIGADYRRIRLGIGHPGDKDKVLGYVLGKFKKEERKEFDAFVDKVAEALPAMLEGTDSDFTTKLALLVKPEKKEKKEPKPKKEGDK